MLTIRLTRVSPTHHRFAYIRADGSGESKELETKTFLFHDFIHFAVESEAGLKDSFYGLLSSGRFGFTELSANNIMADGVAMPTAHVNKEIETTEQIVGALTRVVQGKVSSEDVIAGIGSIFKGYEKEVPDWFTVEFILRVKERMRRLMGEWNATPFGGTMKLIWQ